MINKENNVRDPESHPKDEGYVDVVNMELQCHFLVKDKDTGEILVNKRG